MSFQAVSGWESSSQTSLFWMALIDGWSVGIFKMCSTSWCLNNLECCQPPVGVGWCSGYSLRWHYCVKGFSVARVMWVEGRTAAYPAEKQTKTKQQNSHVVTVVVTAISSTSSPPPSTTSRHWITPFAGRQPVEDSCAGPCMLGAVGPDSCTAVGRGRGRSTHWSGFLPLGWNRNTTRATASPRRKYADVHQKKRGAVTNLFAPHRELLQQTIAEEWSWLQVGTKALPEWWFFLLGFFFSSLGKNFPLHLLSPLKMGDTQVAATFKVFNSTHNTCSSSSSS